MNFNIITLGCKVNQYESQAMREDLLKTDLNLPSQTHLPILLL